MGCCIGLTKFYNFFQGDRWLKYSPSPGNVCYLILRILDCTLIEARVACSALNRPANMASGQGISPTRTSRRV